MVNQEIFGGLVSALSRGESLQKAMFSLFNAGYPKKEIEEAAMLLKSQTPEQVMQKTVESHVEEKKKPEEKDKNKKEKPREKPQEEIQKSPEKPENNSKSEKKVKQDASKYGEETKDEFRSIIDQAIKNLSDLKSPVKVVRPDKDFKPPILIQKVSDYDSSPRKKVSKFALIILFILLIILLGALIALFVFKNQLIEIFNNLNLF
jgi:hypothetical protein